MAGSLLIRLPGWAGQVPADHPRLGQVRATAPRGAKSVKSHETRVGGWFLLCQLIPDQLLPDSQSVRVE